MLLCATILGAMCFSAKVEKVELFKQETELKKRKKEEELVNYLETNLNTQRKQQG